MAAVLSALAPLVLQMIKDIPEEELRLLLGVSVKINKLADKVGSLEAYLADAERRRVNDAMVQRWASKLKGALYEATNILELCEVDAKEWRGRCGCWVSMENKAPGCVQPLLFCLRNPSFAHTMGGRIKELNASLDDVRGEMAQFGFVKLDAYQLMTPPSDATPYSRTTTSLLQESAVVGDTVQADTNALVQELLSDEPGIKVVSITGAGGMGKTTLAKKIFNDMAIKAEFRSRIWLSITELYNADKLLSSAIAQAGGEKDPRGDQQILTRTLVAALSSSSSVGSKFLLVLDDVWSERPWVHILQSPVLEAGRAQSRSRVIITTRDQHLVKKIGAPYYQHRVKPLCDEDAWSLLKKQFLPQDAGNKLNDVKYIGMGIIKNCDGLPLAVKAIGGFLRKKDITVHEWKDVLGNPAWQTDETHHELNSTLRLSYEDLPPPLKQCFLHYSLIPKGLNLHCDTVVGMWMSEGFLRISSRDVGERREEEARGICYYWDLIRRNLIEPVDGVFIDRAVCGMHDVIRSFARHIAKEEALVVGRPGQISSFVSSPKIRRLSLESTELSESETTELLESEPELLRTLIINGRMKLETSNASSDFALSRFGSLRALFVRHAESDRFIESLGKLKHLRFLYLYGTDISRLPDDIDKMWFLEYIHIEKCEQFSGQTPRSILKLEHLRYLVIGGDGTKFIVPRGFSGLTNLRTLAVFPVQMDGGDWCSLQELGPLAELRSLELRGLEAVPSGSMAGKAMLGDKKDLRVLNLWCYDYDDNHHQAGEEVAVVIHASEEDCRRAKEVFDGLQPSPRLEKLAIYKYIGKVAPCWMCSRSEVATIDLRSLTSLEMVDLPFCNQLPDGLWRLPNLENLIVDFAPAIVRVGPEFLWPQDGRRRALARGATTSSFPSLQYLRLKGLTGWEEWEWAEEDHGLPLASMPALHTLYISGCKLGRLPAGLASSRRLLALRQLVLVDVAKIRAVENFQSVTTLVVIRCPRLRAISGFPRMQRVVVVSCPRLTKVRLEGGSAALDTMELGDPDMATLPEYLRDLKPRTLRVLDCHQNLRDLLLSSSSTTSDDSSSLSVYRDDKIKDCEKLFVMAPSTNSGGLAATSCVVADPKLGSLVNQHYIYGRVKFQMRLPLGADGPSGYDMDDSATAAIHVSIGEEATLGRTPY